MKLTKNKKFDKTFCCDLSLKNDFKKKIKGKDEELALLAKALGHPVRVQIVRTLAQKGSCVCGEIVGLVNDRAQSTVSQHLKILKESGLVCGEIEGAAVCYCLDAQVLKRLRVLIAEI